MFELVFSGAQHYEVIELVFRPGILEIINPFLDLLLISFKGFGLFLFNPINIHAALDIRVVLFDGLDVADVERVDFSEFLLHFLQFLFGLNLGV